MSSSIPLERRAQRRYIVRGRVKLMVNYMEIWADLVNFGQGGMLIRAPFEITPPLDLEFRVIAHAYPEVFSVNGQIVGGQGKALAIHFLERSAGADALLQWLEWENFPWASGNPSAGETLPSNGRRDESMMPPPATENDAETSLEDVYQYG